VIENGIVLGHHVCHMVSLLQVFALVMSLKFITCRIELDPNFCQVGNSVF
jgi:hypothetical protein